jgi:hypothetical protein
VYDAPVRSLALVCVLLAGSAVVAADPRAERALAEQKCLARDPGCDWLGTLSSLERASVRRAMAARGYEPDPEPWGKWIATIHVFNEDVFAEPNRVLQFFNNFHVTTKEYAIREELRIGVGEVWDPERVLETARRLRDPLFTSVVVIIPVKSAFPGNAVDMLIVTRDIWSLRLNTQYTYQQGALTDLSIALSENNFLGRRILFAWALAMDQGAIATGPIYLDKNVLGHGIRLRVDGRVILNRENLFEGLGFSEGPPTNSTSDSPGLNHEGTQSSIEVSRPLFALASKWGWSARFSHRYAIDRRFRGLGLLPVDCSTGTCAVPSRTLVDDQGRTRTVFSPVLDRARDTADGTLIGVQYETRRWDLSTSAVRQWGDEVKQQVTIGYTVEDTQLRPLESFPGTAAEREAFIEQVLPRSELSSTPFISYGAFAPRFRTLRNVDTFDLAEDIRLGPGFDVGYAAGLKPLGSTNAFQRATLSGSYAWPLCRDGLIRTSAGISTRYQGGSFIDNTATFGVRVVTPTYRWARIVGESAVGTRWNDTIAEAIGFFSIGSANGLRGFEIGEFRGQRLIRNQVELRTVPVPFWVLRLGAVAFYEAGGAANTFTTRAADGSRRWTFPLHQDVGVGLRMLIPQTARDLFRFDFAVPLDGRDAGKLRFIAGFDTAF